MPTRCLSAGQRRNLRSQSQCGTRSHISSLVQYVNDEAKVKFNVFIPSGAYRRHRRISNHDGMNQGWKFTFLELRTYEVRCDCNTSFWMSSKWKIHRRYLELEVMPCDESVDFGIVLWVRVVIWISMLRINFSNGLVNRLKITDCGVITWFFRVNWKNLKLENGRFYHLFLAWNWVLGEIWFILCFKCGDFHKKWVCASVCFTFRTNSPPPPQDSPFCVFIEPQFFNNF